MNAIELPLNVTYRCPKMVVKEAQQFVSDLTAHENNSEGAVRRIDSEELFTENLTAEDVIICRNNAPLITMAYQLLRRKIACHVRGRDIGVGLISLANRWKFHSFDVLEGHLETYLQREKAKALEAKQENRAQSIEDKVETLRVFIDAARCDGISTLTGLVKMIKDLFEDDQSNRKPTLTLSTVHKAKGKEWPRVYLLGRDQLMPSKWANSDWQIEQENNLIYVAITRAMKELIYVDLPC